MSEGIDFKWLGKQDSNLYKRSQSPYMIIDIIELFDIP